LSHLVTSSTAAANRKLIFLESKMGAGISWRRRIFQLFFSVY